MEELIAKENFTFKRNYRTGVTEVEEIIACKIKEIRRPPVQPPPRMYDGSQNKVQWVEIG